jgi:multimeric flavodoxin WrbA
MYGYIIHDEKDSETFLIKQTLKAVLDKKGWKYQSIGIKTDKIGRCLICNYCNEKNPGVCVRKDRGNEIVHGTAQCDLFVIISSISFGGYSALTKKGFERTIPNIHPLFTMHRGELHHRLRYKNHPDLLVLGWQKEKNTEEKNLFNRLAERNATNFLSNRYASRVFSGKLDPDYLTRSIIDIMDRLYHGKWIKNTDPEYPSMDCSHNNQISEWLILVSSGRRKSNSRSIAEYLKTKLAETGSAVKIIDLAAEGMIDKDMSTIAEQFDKSKGVFFISPLYHDTLSYPAISLMEYLYSRKDDLPKDLPAAVLIHSGYPEPVHSKNAIGIVHNFIETIGWHWTGGFSAGTTSPIGGNPLNEAGFLTKKLRRNLDKTAAALTGNGTVPESVKPVLPPRLFCFAGNIMFKKEFKRKGVNYNAKPFSGYSEE